MKKYVLMVAVFCTVTLNSQWVQLNSGTASNLRTLFFVNNLTGFSGGAGGIIIKTTNGGTNWSPLSSGLSADINSIYFINSNTGFACGNSGNLVMTTNSGMNWIPLTSGVTDHLYAISFSGLLNGVCSGSGGTLLYTSNGGLNWTIAANGFLSSYYGIFMFNPTTAFAGGVNTIFQPLLARTTNGGANWSYSAFYLNSNEGNLRDFYFFTSSEGIAVSNVWDGRGGISYTSNSGANWTTQFTGNALNSVDFSGSTGYSGGINGSIIKSTDAGATWITQSSGVSAVLRSVEFIDSVTGFICGDGGTILKTTNGGVLAIEPVSAQIPEKFSLSQNYPNPFNPSTKIRFKIPEKGFVELKIFDLLGREVAALVNELIKPGEYETIWIAEEIPAGVYFYRMVSGVYSETRKMILIK